MVVLEAGGLAELPNGVLGGWGSRRVNLRKESWVHRSTWLFLAVWILLAGSFASAQTVNLQRFPEGSDAGRAGMASNPGEAASGAPGLAIDVFCATIEQLALMKLSDARQQFSKGELIRLRLRAVKDVRGTGCLLRLDVLASIPGWENDPLTEKNGDTTEFWWNTTGLADTGGSAVADIRLRTASPIRVDPCGVFDVIAEVVIQTEDGRAVSASPDGIVWRVGNPAVAEDASSIPSLGVPAPLSGSLGLSARGRFRAKNPGSTLIVAQLSHVDESVLAGLSPDPIKRAELAEALKLTRTASVVAEVGPARPPQVTAVAMTDGRSRIQVSAQDTATCDPVDVTGASGTTLTVPDGMGRVVQGIYEPPPPVPTALSLRTPAGPVGVCDSLEVETEVVFDRGELNVPVLATLGDGRSGSVSVAVPSPVMSPANLTWLGPSAASFKVSEVAVSGAEVLPVAARYTEGAVSVEARIEVPVLVQNGLLEVLPDSGTPPDARSFSRLLGETITPTATVFLDDAAQRCVEKRDATAEASFTLRNPKGESRPMAGTMQLLEEGTWVLRAKVPGPKGLDLEDEIRIEVAALAATVQIGPLTPGPSVPVLRRPAPEPPDEVPVLRQPRN